MDKLNARNSIGDQFSIAAHAFFLLSCIYTYFCGPSLDISCFTLCVSSLERVHSNRSLILLISSFASYDAFAIVLPFFYYFCYKMKCTAKHKAKIKLFRIWSLSLLTIFNFYSFTIILCSPPVATRSYAIHCRKCKTECCEGKEQVSFQERKKIYKWLTGI